MQDYNPTTRQRNTIKRIATYVFMVTVTLAASWLAILLVQGYRFNASTGQLEQGALAQVASVVVQSDAYLDAESRAQRTPVKIGLSPGQHTITLRAKGYQEWTRTVTVKPSQLVWLDYARMLPASITTSPLRSTGTITSLIASPGKHWLFAASVVADAPELTLVDIRDPAEVQFVPFVVPGDKFTLKPTAASRYVPAQWDESERYCVVRHIAENGASEWLRVDRSDAAATVNLTALFGADMTDLRFVDKSSTVWYALRGGDLVRLELDGAATTIASKVTQYEQDGSRLVYTTTKDATSTVVMRRDDSSITIGSYATGVAQRSVVGSYYGDDYVAVSTTDRIDVYRVLARESAATQVARFRTSESTSWLTMPQSGRFVVGGNGSSYATYDIETDAVSTASFSGATATDGSAPLWLDNYYLASTGGGRLDIAEYDGANRHEIAQVVPGSYLTLSADGKYLFSVGPSGGSAVLQVSKLIVDNK